MAMVRCRSVRSAVGIRKGEMNSAGDGNAIRRSSRLRKERGQGRDPTYPLYQFSLSITTLTEIPAHCPQNIPLIATHVVYHLGGNLLAFRTTAAFWGIDNGGTINANKHNPRGDEATTAKRNAAHHERHLYRNVECSWKDRYRRKPRSYRITPQITTPKTLLPD